MQKFARVCCSCFTLVGCIKDKKSFTCDWCEKWDDCWMDLVEYKTIKESHGFCPVCLMKQLSIIKDRRVAKIPTDIERRNQIFRERCNSGYYDQKREKTEEDGEETSKQG